MYLLAIEVLLIFFLLLINGLFSMSEIAVVSSRKVRLKGKADGGSLGAATALELAENPDRFLSTVQIGITLVGILSGAFGGAAIAALLAPYFQRVPMLVPYAEEISFGLVVLVITYFSLVIGELVPKTLALTHPEPIASVVSRPMRFISKMAAPVVWLLSASTALFLKVFRIKPSGEAAITEEEIRAHIAHGTQIGVLNEEEQELLQSVIRLDDQRVSALMTPRTDVAWINLDDSDTAIQTTITASQYSRLPVGDGSLDDVVGFVKAKDLLAQTLRREPFNLTAVLKEPVFVPETKTALELLDLFRISHTQLGIVLDEYAVVQGVVTVNDLLEAIVGELPSTGMTAESAVQREDGSWLLDGRLFTAEFKEILGIRELPAEEHASYQTLAGFVLARTRTLPQIGDRFEWDTYIFEVVDMDGKRVDRLLVTPLP